MKAVDGMFYFVEVKEYRLDIVNVLVAAGAAWIFGAAWYGILGRQWMAAAGLKAGANGRPEGSNSLMPFVLAAFAMILVAGMMRHMFGMAGIISVGKGALAGAGTGLFVVAPWILINNAYALRPFLLTLIDAGYAVFGCAIIGAVLRTF